MYYCTYNQSPVGNLLLASENGEYLAGLWLQGQKYYPESIPNEEEEKPNLKIFVKTSKWLDNYFSGDIPTTDTLPIAPQGTVFQKKVWQILCQIPYGKTITYGEIAKKMVTDDNRSKFLARAVGSAVGHNPISIIIPCHRVLGIGGRLTGYAGGIENKCILLKLEGIKINDEANKKISHYR